jgi:hypothetical protein
MYICVAQKATRSLLDVIARCQVSALCPIARVNNLRRIGLAGL